MDIKDLREQIDKIDDDMVELFCKRMKIASQIADFKQEKNLPVLNHSREREILNRITEKLDDEMAVYTKNLYTTIFDLSRSYQDRHMKHLSEVTSVIKTALEETSDTFPSRAVVACQGVEGAYSQLACDKIFSMPNIIYFNTFEGVFQAVEKNMCRYGILPLENSLHGSVNEVYDLMKKYKFYIVKSVKLMLSNTLLGVKGAKLSDIKEVYSHNQAIGQCSEFLKNNPQIKVNLCENTAVAASIVANLGRKDVAAISSRNCAELYGLISVCENISNNDNNYTRFICISKKLEIFPGSNKISLMFMVPNRPGALYGILSKFSALGLNMTKLESRPIPGSDFEFMFYSDMDASVNSEEVMNLLAQLEEGPQQFEFLGNYSEI